MYKAECEIVKSLLATGNALKLLSAVAVNFTFCLWLRQNAKLIVNLNG